MCIMKSVYLFYMEITQLCYQTFVSFTVTHFVEHVSGK